MATSNEQKQRQLVKKYNLAAEQAHRAVIAEQTALPSAYTDLLMPAVRDPKQDGVNIFAPDFPFGPGTAEMSEDLHFERYKIADKMRQVAAVKMATIGFQTFDEYAGSDAHESDNMEVLRKTFNNAVEDLKKEAQSGNSNLEKAPFDFSDGKYMKQANEKIQKNKAFGMKEMEEDGAFKQQIDGTIRTEDLVQALQISKTFEYVTQVMEASAGAADGQVELMKDGKLAENIPSMVKETMAKIREGKTIDIGPASQADMTKTYQNQTSVQGNPWLLKKREELLKIYQADAQVLRQYLGYYDRYTEPRRAKLRNKLRDSWKDWKGMRRAFPSYMLVLAGKQGTGLFDVMSDLYSWTAVQQIETREMADNAGSECDLVLSNMRKRITGGDQRPTDLYGNPAFDSQMEVTVGNHMYVGMGYGPDFSHMQKFSGRVTSVNHGPMTQVQLKSYSTTLNNQPNSGRGFYVDGWDGQQSLAEAILYTISQTSGLEGLGRRAPGQATDRLGRSARGFAEEDYRSSVMVSLYRTFGSPGLAWMMEDEDTRRRAGTLLDIVARNGLDSVKDMVLGDPQIYENVWVTNSPEASGPGEMFFGGLADYLTGGKGWGWAARPGRTAWSQLKEQAMLFPEYVVATRPYNSHVPLSDLDTHPLRETLYFGPKTGSYIHSSREPGSTDAFNQVQDEELEKLLREESDTGSQYEEWVPSGWMRVEGGRDEGLGILPHLLHLGRALIRVERGFCKSDRRCLRPSDSHPSSGNRP